MREETKQDSNIKFAPSKSTFNHMNISENTVKMPTKENIEQN